MLGVVALTVVGATTLRAPEQAGAAGCTSLPGKHFALVVDFGTATGRDLGLKNPCVSEAAARQQFEARRARGVGIPRISGMDVLKAAYAVVTDSSGMICLIDSVGTPAGSGGCARAVNGHLTYWAYFKGTAAGWTYSSKGPATSVAKADEVEGWHFVTVAAGDMNGAEPPRNLPDGPSYLWQTTCDPAPSAPRPAPAPAPGPSSPEPAVPAGGSATSGGTEDSGSRPATGPKAGSATTEPKGSATAKKGTSAGPTTSTGQGDGAGGLRSTETAPVLSEKQFEAARSEVSGGHPVGAIVAGASGAGALTIAMVFLTRRSRRRRGDDGTERS